MKARGEEVSFLEEEGRGSTTILWQNGSVNKDGGGGRGEKYALSLLLLLCLSTNVFDIFWDDESYYDDKGDKGDKSLNMILELVWFLESESESWGVEGG